MGKKHFHGDKISIALTGKKKSPEHVRKVIEANLGQTRPSIAQENSTMWKGNEVGYDGLHDWVRKYKGYPDKCEHCKKIGERSKGRWNIHWANISKTYKRVMDDWIGLCRRCHYAFDKKIK